MTLRLPLVLVAVFSFASVPAPAETIAQLKEREAKVRAVVEKVMQGDPVERVQSAAELRVRLERVQRSMTPAARRRRFLLASAAAVIAGGGGVWLWPKRTPPEQSPPTES